jgi:hypothetical protein
MPGSILLVIIGLRTFIDLITCKIYYGCLLESCTLKRWSVSTRLHDAKSLNAAIFILVTVRTSNLTKCKLFSLRSWIMGRREIVRIRRKAFWINFFFRSICKVKRVKWPESKADHSPPPCAEVENAWSYTFISPFVAMLWCLGAILPLP